MKNDINKTLLKKYPHLEVNVVKYSEVKKDNKYFRIDSEPFKRSRLLFNKNIEYIKLSEIAIINPSKSEIYNLDENTQVTFLSMQNLGNGFINKQEKVIIKDFIEGYTYFAENDILIAKITPCMEHGKCAIARKLYNGIGFGSTEFNVFRIKDKRFSKEYIFSFLNRENIRQIAADNMVGTSGRQRVSTEFYENLLIPMFSKEFQLEIETMVKDSHKALENSKKLYKEAEKILYEALGLDAENPLESILSFREKNKVIHNQLKRYKRLNISIRTYKESYLKTGRLDAEYYQVKYDLIENIIKDYSKGYCKLSDIGFFTNGSFIPESFYTEQAKRAYIRIKELSLDSPINMKDCIYINDKFKNSNETIVKENDFVIATIGNTIGKINLITKELEGSFISNNTSRFRLTDKNINPIFLELLLRNSIVQEQIQREFTQTAQPKISNNSLENIIIPKIDYIIQKKIESRIKKSFELRDKSKELLENAKVKIENAIIDS